MLKIYCVHPISGLDATSVFNYYDRIQKTLESYGYIVFSPMYAKNELRTEIKFRESDYRNPTCTNHAIFRRDSFMVNQSDVVFANFLSAKNVSVGSCMELAWASWLHKHTIVIMEKENPHRHAFILEAADIVFETEEEALIYLKTLAKKEI